jgi:hypothetical protein
VNPEERQLLESTARSVLRLQEDIADRLTGIEVILRELFRSNERPELAIARLRLKADLLRLKGTPCAYLDAFLTTKKVG